MQLDQGEKGFSFMKEGPLDMRMDPDSNLTAADIVNTYSEEQLGEVFREMGEEPQWKRAARAIVFARNEKPIQTTEELSAILLKSLGFKKGGRLHPATLVFQALRIVVNRELEAIEKGLTKALQFLAPKGRIGTISFHSLEDRIAKEMFRSVCFRSKNKYGLEKSCGFLRILTKKPWMASLQEIRKNRRARSAKMRFAERV
jgi:16S rRNA (cytosine1402-N4)-methyltransferase